MEIHYSECNWESQKLLMSHFIPLHGYYEEYVLPDGWREHLPSSNRACREDVDLVARPETRAPVKLHFPQRGGIGMSDRIMNYESLTSSRWQNNPVSSKLIEPASLSVCSELWIVFIIMIRVYRYAEFEWVSIGISKKTRYIAVILLFYIIWREHNIFLEINLTLLMVTCERSDNQYE